MKPPCLTTPRAAAVLLAGALLIASCASPAAETAPVGAVKPLPAKEVTRKLDPFYTKVITVDGLLIVSSPKVSNYAMKEVAYLVRKMLATRPDVLADLVRRNVYITVMAYTEMTTDMPETRKMSPW